MNFLCPTKKQSYPVQNIQKTEQKNEYGFSLIELVIVLFCLSVLLGISVPPYQQIVDYRNLKLAANQLYADLVECQSMAKQSSNPYSLQFIQENTYQVQEGNVQRKSVTLPKWIRFVEHRLSRGQSALEFNGKGHPVGGGTLILQNAHGKQIGFTIHLHTGQIQKKEGSELKNGREISE